MGYVDLPYSGGVRHALGMTGRTNVLWPELMAQFHLLCFVRGTCQAGNGMGNLRRGYCSIKTFKNRQKRWLGYTRIFDSQLIVNTFFCVSIEVRVLGTTIKRAGEK